MDAGDVIEAGFEMELSEQQLRLEFDSMVVSLEALTGQLEDAKAKNVKLEATNSTLSAELDNSEFQRGLLFTEVEIKDDEIKTLKGEINSSNVKTNTLIVKINWLNVELKSSQSVVTKKKSELRDVKEKLEKTEKQNKIELMDLKNDYEASSKDLHLMTSRCDRLRDENN